MSNSSVTESEPEDDIGTAFPADFSHLSNSGCKEVWELDVELAIQTIEAIDIAVLQDMGFHQVISGASTVIISFLTEFISDSEQRLPDKLCAFTSLLHVNFISILFKHREIFHRIAAQVIVPGTAATTVVCWVDVILYKLAEVAVIVAGGCIRRPSTAYACDNIRQLCEDDNLRAASQLPQKWTSIPNIIVSEHASPAAKRLALYLLFAVYIISPQLKPYDPWRGSGIQSGEIIDILHIWTKQGFLGCSPGRRLPFGIQERERISYSMIICLLAAVDSRSRLSCDPHILSPFRPRSLDTLLRLVEVIMSPGDTTLPAKLAVPCSSLDLPQNIIVRWGHTVPWCWAKWRDQRLANAECVTYLTATWLYHLDSPLFGMLPRDPELQNRWILDLAPCLLQDSEAARSAIFHVLHNIGAMMRSFPSEDLESSTMNVLFQACCATVELVDRSSSGSDCQSYLLELCKCLNEIFVLLGDKDEELIVKNLIAKFLTLVGPKTCHLVFNAFQGSNKVSFIDKLDELIHRSRQRLADMNSEDRASSQNYLLSIKLSLDFITIIWDSETQEFIHHQTVSSFLALLVRNLSEQNPASLPSSLLVDSLFMTLSAMELSSPSVCSALCTDVWDNEALWKLPMRAGYRNLIIGSAFAHHVITVAKLCDGLGCAEAWDFLRDMILLIFSRHFINDEEPLALICCPIICIALTRLIKEIDKQTIWYILSSPWTQYLCTELRNLFKNRGTESTDYFNVLKGRLEFAGQNLIDELNYRLQPDKERPTRQGISTPQGARLNYHWINGCFRLLPFPDMLL